MTPKLSIITVNLNDRSGLQKTIDSVLKQTFKDYEYLIVDGGSTDGSREVIQAHAGRIAWWVSESDTGIFNAMNKGIRRAQGEYCLFLNSGDILVDQDVLRRVFAAEYSEDILYGNARVSKDGRVVFTATPPDKLTLRAFYKRTIPHQSAFIKRELFARYGFYSEKYRINGDYEFWIRAVILGDCTTRHVDLDVCDYNLQGISSDPLHASWVTREVNSILSALVSGRVLADYEAWRLEQEELQPLFWLRRKPFLYKPVLLLFTIAAKLDALKKRLSRRRK